MGSKPGPSQTSTTSLPPYLQQAQQNLIGTGQNLTSQFTGAAPNYGVAGLNTDQLFANDLARRTAAGVFNTGSIPAYDVFGMGKNWQGQITQPNAQAAQLDPNSIQQFMNPYISASLNPTLDKLRQTYQDQQAKISADAAGSHMFGGSREAVQHSLANRNYMDTAAKTTGDMLSAGFDKASGLAQGNVANQQQANMANASNAQAINNLLFQGDQNDASRFLQALQLQSGLNNDDLNRKLAAITSLASFGNQTQTVQQNALNAPFKALQQLLSTTPGLNNVGSTTTSTSSQQVNPLSAILPLAMLLSGNPFGAAAGGTGLLASLFGGSTATGDGSWYGPSSVGGPNGPTPLSGYK